jgi:beta-lactamase class A
MQRPQFIRALAAGAAAFAVPLVARAQAATPAQAEFERWERRSGGRLGVLAIDTGSRHRIEYRGFEAFPMCSTFKLLLAGAILARVDTGRERLDRSITYGKSDLLAYAPVTTAHVAAGSMTVGKLCAAAVEVSDNTAANLLLATIGGPDGLNDFIRTLGDRITQLDRIEPALNEAAIGDPRDTTTPNAMSKDAEKLVLGSVLTAASRKLLQSWLIAATPGLSCIRAGLPSTWTAGDKTGSGERGTRNDVAVIWRPNRAPLIIAAYLTGATKIDAAARDATLAAVGKIVSTTFA